MQDEIALTPDIDTDLVCRDNVVLEIMHTSVLVQQHVDLVNGDKQRHAESGGGWHGGNEQDAARRADCASLSLSLSLSCSAYSSLSVFQMLCSCTSYFLCLSLVSSVIFRLPFPSSSKCSSLAIFHCLSLSSSILFRLSLPSVKRSTLVPFGDARRCV